MSRIRNWLYDASIARFFWKAMSLMYWPPLGTLVVAVMGGPAIHESGATRDDCHTKFGLCGAFP
jgi:hypothetical protein